MILSLPLLYFLYFTTTSSSSSNNSIHYPPFSWDTVPVFWQGANVSGAFNSDALDTLQKFPVVVIEKAQGQNGTVPGWYAEDYMLQAAQQIKSRNNSIELVWYWNSVDDWIMYRMHYEFLNHSNWWARNCSGDIIYVHGDTCCPQPPQGMLSFDMSQIDCATWWANKCLNMTLSGYFDGCNADKVYTTKLNGQCNNTAIAYKNNKFKALETLQKNLNDSGKGTLWINDGNELPGVRGICFEGWGNFEGAILDMNNATAKNPNIMVKAHAGYCTDGSNCGCVGQPLINDLSAFLVSVQKYGYFTCNRNWLMNTTNYGWHKEYEKPLGAPVQKNGVKVDDTYYRSFETGTAVIFNVTSRQGRIFWSNEWDYTKLKQFGQRITDWYDNIIDNYDIADSRRIYISEFDVLL